MQGFGILTFFLPSLLIIDNINGGASFLSSFYSFVGLNRVALDKIATNPNSWLTKTVRRFYETSSRRKAKNMFKITNQRQVATGKTINRLSIIANSE